MSYAAENGAIPILSAQVHEKASSPVSQISPFTFRNARLRDRHPTSPMSSEASAEDDPLYMSSKTDVQTQHSLSPIINRSLKNRTRPTEANTKIGDAIARENRAWDVINREISEWQIICQTGRPSWWSPVSKWTRSEARSTWKDKIHAIPPWHMNQDYNRQPKQRYDAQRRAVTDSYLADNNNVQGLAHLVAVQLLSACFTLPPDYAPSHKSSAYHCFDTLGAGDTPNSRLISSLRMHTEVRYAPAFGYETRNTSPNYRWHAAYDGPSRSSSHAQSPDRNSSDNLSFIKSSNSRTVRGALHASEGSAAGYLLDCHELQNKKSNSLKVARSRAGPERNVQSCPSSPGDSDFYLSRCLQLGLEVPPQYANGAQRRSNRSTLQPVIRSDPHNVYIQPVKDMIVKRWHSLRCRFGKRLSRGNHGSLGTISSSLISATTPSSSRPGETIPRAQVFSSDLKEKSRHTRERSDIHSSSIASSPRYNTPTSAPSSGIVSPAQFELTSPQVETLERSVEEPNIVTAERKQSIGLRWASTSLPSSTLPGLETPLTIPSTPIPFNSSPDFSIESGISTSPVSGNRRPSQAALPFSKRHTSQRRQRRSMLSEVLTPDDIEVQTALNITAHALTSPVEGPVSNSTAEQSPSTPGRNIEARESVPDWPSFQPITMNPTQNEPLEVDRKPSVAERPTIIRMNTSGTQVFIPAEDGVEVDGLPVGLPAEAWDETVGGIKRREKSFL